MEQTVHNPEIYDFRQYDHIWQRVAPNLEPYPGMTQATAVTAPAAPPPPPAVVRQEAALPGAQSDPCCMGSAAMELLAVLTGYIEDALSDRRATLALARQAPSWARQRLRDIAAGQGAQARQLMAAHYLITGEAYRPSVPGPQDPPGRWCPALRERYHAAACTGFNLARSAATTTDPCLSRLLNGLSAASYRYAEDFMALLERSLQKG